MDLVAPPEEPARDERLLRGSTPFAGATVANLSPLLADELEMPQSRRGVVVAAVEPGTPAMRLGLQPRDIVVTLNGGAVESSADLERRSGDGRRGWKVEVDRGGQRLVQTIR